MKSRLQETVNLLACADGSTDTKKHKLIYLDVSLEFTTGQHLVTMYLYWKFFSLSKLHGDWAIQKVRGSHHCWMSWPALDKGNLLQQSSASTKERENSWPGLWLPCLLRRLTWVAAENMRLSTHSACTQRLLCGCTQFWPLVLWPMRGRRSDHMTGVGQWDTSQ